MGCGRWIATTALGTTLIAGPIIHTHTAPPGPDKPQHTHQEVKYQHVSTTGNIIILGSGTVITPGTGTLVIEGGQSRLRGEG